VSSYDPAREAERWAAEAGTGTVVVWGGAGAEAARRLLGRGSAPVFWVEPRAEVWQALLTWEDWTGALASPAWWPWAGSIEGWEALFLDAYHPLWDGALRLLEWRPALAGRDDEGRAFRRVVDRALGAVAADASTQARFAERWYRNTLINLRHLGAAAAPACPGARVVVAGAGPTLGDHLDDPADRRWLETRDVHGGRLLSTDTALPALGARGLVPDLVLCLDGQLATYHHFVPGAPAGVPLVADLASLPLLDRLGPPVIRYLSGHPFGSVVRRFYPELPTLDGSDGHVSGLAAQTARALGAARVDTWGVDFAYRDGQAYTRGTYVYPVAERASTRLSPLETRLAGPGYGAPGRQRTVDAQGRAWDTTPLLRDYRFRWDQGRPAPAPVNLGHRGDEGRWEAFRAAWTRRLVDLPRPPAGQNLSQWVRTLAPDRREDWLALWPLALALHRAGVPVDQVADAVVPRALSFLQD